MRRPLAPNTAIDTRRIQRWIQHFTGYHESISAVTLESWLNQFSGNDRDLAARLLDAVAYVTSGEIRASYRNLLDSLKGWHRQKASRTGNWFFVPFSVGAGESGDAMTHVFRMANSMSNRFFTQEFIHPSELLEKMPGPDDTVVLIDDFAGTGNQACRAWKNCFQELFPNSPRILLMLVGATTAAIDKIREETEMQPVCDKVFRPRDDLFNTACNNFTPAEKATILRYCQKADAQHPKGYGNCGLVVVLAHQCPNNSIALLHCVNDDWYGIFPRN
jgi:hypothetical protein